MRGSKTGKKVIVYPCFLFTKICHFPKTNKTSTQKLNGETCKWTNYEDYIRYKNMKLMVQDVEGIHESLNGNSKTINIGVLKNPYII